MEYNIFNAHNPRNNSDFPNFDNSKLEQKDIDRELIELITTEPQEVPSQKIIEQLNNKRLSAPAYGELTDIHKINYLKCLSRIEKGFYQEVPHTSQVFCSMQQLYAWRRYNLEWFQQNKYLSNFIANIIENLRNGKRLENLELIYLTSDEYCCYWFFLKKINLKDSKLFSCSIAQALSQAVKDPKWCNVIYSKIMNGEEIEYQEYINLQQQQKEFYQKEIISKIVFYKLLHHNSLTDAFNKNTQGINKEIFFSLLINGYRLNANEITQLSPEKQEKYQETLNFLGLESSFLESEKVNQVAKPILAQTLNKPTPQTSTLAYLQIGFFYNAFNKKDMVDLYYQLLKYRLNVHDYLRLNLEQRNFYQDCLSIVIMNHPFLKLNNIMLHSLHTYFTAMNEKKDQEINLKILDFLINYGVRETSFNDFTKEQLNYYHDTLKMCDLYVDSLPPFISKELFSLLININPKLITYFLNKNIRIKLQHYYLLNKQEKKIYQIACKNSICKKIVINLEAYIKYSHQGRLSPDQIQVFEEALIHGYRLSSTEKSKITDSEYKHYQALLSKLDLEESTESSTSSILKAKSEYKHYQALLSNLDLEESTESSTISSILKVRTVDKLDISFFKNAFEKKDMISLYEQLKKYRLCLNDYNSLDRKEKKFYQDCLSVLFIAHQEIEPNLLNFMRTYADCLSVGTHERHVELVYILINFGVRLNKVEYQELTLQEKESYNYILLNYSLYPNSFPYNISKELFELLISCNRLTDFFELGIKIDAKIYRSLTINQQIYYQYSFGNSELYNNKNRKKLHKLVKKSFENKELDSQKEVEELEDALIHGDRLSKYFIDFLTPQEYSYYISTLESLALKSEIICKDQPKSLQQLKTVPLVSQVTDEQDKNVQDVVITRGLISKTLSKATLEGLWKIITQEFLSYLQDSSNQEKMGKILSRGIWNCPIEKEYLTNNLHIILEKLNTKTADEKHVGLIILRSYLQILGVTQLETYDANISLNCRSIWGELLADYQAYEQPLLEKGFCHVSSFIKIKQKEIQNWSKKALTFLCTNAKNIQNIQKLNVIDPVLKNKILPVFVLKSNEGLEFDAHEMRFDNQGMSISLQRCSEEKAKENLKFLLPQDYLLLNAQKQIALDYKQIVLEKLDRRIKEEKNLSFLLIYETEMSMRRQSSLSVEFSDEEISEEESSSDEEVMASGKRKLTKAKPAKKKKVEGGSVTVVSQKTSTSFSKSSHANEWQGLHFLQEINYKTVTQGLKKPDKILSVSLLIAHLLELQAIEQPVNSRVMLQKDLKGYQWRNVSRASALAAHGKSYFLSDKVGLGKTIQMIAKLLITLNSQPGHVLVAVTASTQKQTSQAFKNYARQAVINEFEEAFDQMENWEEEKKKVLYQQLISYNAFLSGYIEKQSDKYQKNLSNSKRENNRSEKAQRKVQSVQRKIDLAKSDLNTFQIWTTKVQQKLKDPIATYSPQPSANSNLKELNLFDLVISSASKKTFQAKMQNLNNETKKVLFLTQDILETNEKLKDRIKELSLSMVVVDEAHLGLDNTSKRFYQVLQEILNAMKIRPPLLLATATPFNNEIESILTLYETSLSPSDTQTRKALKNIKKWMDKSMKYLYESMVQNKSNSHKLFSTLLECFIGFESFHRAFHLQCGRHTAKEVRDVDWKGLIPTKQVNSVTLPLKPGTKQYQLSQQRHEEFSALLKSEMISHGSSQQKKRDQRGVDFNNKNFFNFYQDMQLILFHPNLFLELQEWRTEKARDLVKIDSKEFQTGFVDKIAKYSKEELQAWLKESSTLGQLFDQNDARSLSYSIINNIPSLVFIDRLVMGRILQVCVKTLFDLDIPFLEGSTDLYERKKIVEGFNQGNYPVAFVSKAGVVGVNFNTARCVFMIDRLSDHCNPTPRKQAAGRARRAGEKGEIKIFEYNNDTPLENRVDEIEKSKKALEKFILKPFIQEQISQNKQILNRFYEFIEAIFPPIPYSRDAEGKLTYQSAKKGVLNLLKQFIEDNKDLIVQKFQNFNALLKTSSIEPMQIEEEPVSDPMAVELKVKEIDQEKMEIETQTESTPLLNQPLSLTDYLLKNSELMIDTHVCQIHIQNKNYYVLPTFTENVSTAEQMKEAVILSIGLNIHNKKEMETIQTAFSSNILFDTPEAYKNFIQENIKDWRKKISNLKLNTYCSNNNIKLELYEVSNSKPEGYILNKFYKLQNSQHTIRLLKFNFKGKITYKALLPVQS